MAVQKSGVALCKEARKQLHIRSSHRGDGLGEGFRPKVELHGRYFLFLVVTLACIVGEQAGLVKRKQVLVLMQSTLQFAIFVLT